MDDAAAHCRAVLALDSENAGALHLLGVIALPWRAAHLCAQAQTQRIIRRAEWRWLAEGNKSPWFPGFSLYRQSMRTGWPDSLQKLAADLRTQSADRSNHYN